MIPTYKYPPGDKHVTAIYSTGIGAYENNPLISALQQSWDDGLIGDSMSWWPDYDASCHLKEASVRTELAMQLQDGFETMPHHAIIMSAILSCMRRGYHGRDVFVHGHTERIIARAKANDGSRPNGVRMAGTANSMLIYGLPGTGKTALVTHLGALVPQIIDHTEFQGRPWPCRQVTYLRVAIQQNWTDKALAQAILQEFDRAAGTNYTDELNRKGSVSSYSYLMKFNLAANNHGLGTLILDEVQLLKSNTTLLNFALNFSTSNNVLLVLVGTPASVAIMREDPRFMRRAEVPFDPELKRFKFPPGQPNEYDAMLQGCLKEDGPDPDYWTWFVLSFWHLQYTARAVPLTHELSSLLHNLSAGITSYAVKLFLAAQLIRIGSPKDYLDADAFKEANFASSKASKDYLDDLRNGNFGGLMRYDDFGGLNVADIAAVAAKERAELKKKREAAERFEKLKKIADEEQKRKAPKAKREPKPKPDPVDSDDLPRADQRDFLEP